MKYKVIKNLGDEIVDVIILKETTIIKRTYAPDIKGEKGEYLVSYSNGKQEVFSEEHFKKFFIPVKSLLFD